MPTIYTVKSSSCDCKGENDNTDGADENQCRVRWRTSELQKQMINSQSIWCTRTRYPQAYNKKFCCYLCSEVAALRDEQQKNQWEIEALSDEQLRTHIQTASIIVQKVQPSKYIILHLCCVISAFDMTHFATRLRLSKLLQH